MNAVVDVSNVCWSDEIGPRSKRPLLSRLDQVTEAWRDRYGAGAELVLVVDRALRHQISGEQRADFDRRCRQGLLRVVPFADPVLLSLAQERDLQIVSQDRFVDLRRQFRWIEEQPERFHGWRRDGNGLRFVPSGIVPVSGQVKSRAEEDKDLFIRGLKDHKDVVRSVWRCASRCFMAQVWPEGLLLWPELDRRTGEPVCPDPRCGRPLVRVGDRRPSRELLVERLDLDEDKAVLLRFPLEADGCLEIGRGALTHGINLDGIGREHRDAVARVSRRHLLIEADAALTVSVRDVGSSHGTAVRRWEGHVLGRPRPLEPGEPVRLGPSDQVVLADSVAVRLSGRRYSPDVVPPALGGGGGARTVLR
ncbi:FHA domain-containing protein [Streptomyces sp. NPDC001851]|uniref:FHA domain-containing protein n=1 Tax=Streptomyces sp. NPDC001851 TaxID=3154529 RepID=UPI00332BFAF5